MQITKTTCGQFLVRCSPKELFAMRRVASGMNETLATRIIADSSHWTPTDGPQEVTALVATFNSLWCETNNFINVWQQLSDSPF